MPEATEPAAEEAWETTELATEGIAEVTPWTREEIWLKRALCALLTAEEAPETALLIAEVGMTAGRVVWNVLV